MSATAATLLGVGPHHGLGGELGAVVEVHHVVRDEVLQLLVLGQRHLQPITGEHGVTWPTVDQSEDSIARIAVTMSRKLSLESSVASASL